ncbi:MAG: hypothetical protein WC402_03050 [Candidatus Pacearchaeota archaeon]|jgi:hypothetical protein
MITVKKQKVRKKEVEKVFNSLKKNDLLADRLEYDKEDLQQSYPQLNEKEAKLLFLKIQKWVFNSVKNKKKISSE